MGDELDDLRTTVRAFLSRHCPPDAVRRLMADPSARDAALWRRMAGELGLTGLAVPEEHGGAGCGLTELSVVCEELGRALTPVPYLATAVLAASVVRDAHLLSGIADGSLVVTVARAGRISAGGSTAEAGAADGGTANVSTARGAGTADGGAVTDDGDAGTADGDAVTDDGDAVTDEGGAGTGDAAVTVDGDRLTGTFPYVLDGHLADVIVCVAGDGLYAVRGADADRAAHVTLDQTRRLARVRLDGTPARRVAGDPARLRDVALTALAAEQVGGAQRCLETAVAHAHTRVQFDRPIGSFQAIKHKLADMLLRVESARSAAHEAARVADHEPAALPVYAALAGSYCAEAYLHAAGETIQVLGGIGVTWEHEAQLHLKRAAASARLFGTPEEHRARLAAAAGL